jgi:hypothetical protein
VAAGADAGAPGHQQDVLEGQGKARLVGHGPRLAERPAEALELPHVIDTKSNSCSNQGNEHFWEF